MNTKLSFVGRVVSPDKIDGLRESIDQEVVARQLTESASQRLAYETLIEDLGFIPTWFRDRSSEFWIGFLTQSRHPYSNLFDDFPTGEVLLKEVAKGATQVDPFKHYQTKIDALKESLATPPESLPSVAAAKEADCLTALACRALDEACNIFYSKPELDRTLPKQTIALLMEVEAEQLGLNTLYHAASSIKKGYDVLVEMSSFFVSLLTVLYKDKPVAVRTQALAEMNQHLQHVELELHKAADEVLREDLSIFSDGEKLENEIRSIAERFPKWRDNIFKQARDGLTPTSKADYKEANTGSSDE